MQGVGYLPGIMVSALGGGVPGPGAIPPRSLPIDPGQVQVIPGYQHMLQQQAMLASQYTLQAAQAYEQSVSQTIDSEVTELAHHFKLDDRITRDLDQQMKRRGATFDDDMKALWEILEGARNPAGLLRVKIREMEEGTFRGTATPDRDVEDIAKKFGLDAQASAKLAEVLGKRDDRKRDLRQIVKHLELSNKPSSLIMLMLKDLRAGLPVKDPQYPAAVGSYAHKRGLRRDSKRSRSRSKGGRRRRGRSSSESRSRGRRSRSRGGARSSGAGPLPGQAPRDGEPRPQTLLERFG